MDKTLATKLKARLVEIELQALKVFCSENKTPRTEEILALIRAKDYLAIAQLKCDPSGYTESETERFRVDYQACSMLKKSVNLPVQGVNRIATAMRKFYEAEEQCAITNQVLINWSDNPNDNPWLIDIVTRAQQIIHDILGDLDAEALSVVESNCRFGPGSTRTCKRHSTDGRKFDNPRPGATPRCLEFLRPLLPTLWADCMLGFRIEAAAGITCVPKNAMTDRTIGIEPDLNIWMQLGTGFLIRERLRRYGIDLDRQAEKNASLARRAWVQDLCTIDLSSASDCVSRSLVHLLLPEQWRHLLAISRTDYYEVEGVVRPFNKWSSMGNGYTFELESLIFLALARACGDMRAVAFGDDIIVNKESAPLLIKTLNFVGFRVNTDKTFLSGLFYESCGTDWFCGVNVRPFFLKGDLNDELSATDETAARNLDAIVYQYANAVSATASNAGYGDYRCRRYFSVWRGLLQATPKSNRYRIPVGFNPRGGFECDWDERGSSSASATCFEYLGFTPRYIRTDGDRGPYLSSLHRLERTELRSKRYGNFREEMIALAGKSYSTRSYDRDGEAVRYEGRLSTMLGSCFAWPNRGPWL